VRRAGRKPHPVTGHVCACKGYTEFPHKYPRHCEAVPGPVVRRGWWHINCPLGGRVEHTGKFYGYDCECSQHFSLMDRKRQGRLGTNRDLSFYFGSYQEFSEFLESLQKCDDCGVELDFAEDGVCRSCEEIAHEFRVMEYAAACVREFRASETFGKFVTELKDVTNERYVPHAHVARNRDRFDEVVLLLAFKRRSAESVAVVEPRCVRCSSVMPSSRAGKDLCNACSNCSKCKKHRKEMFWDGLSLLCFSCMARSVTDVVVESPPAVEQVVVPPRRRGVRAGRKLRPEQRRGMCWLKLLRVRDRERFMSIGKYPTVEEITRLFEEMSVSLTTAPKRAVLQHSGRTYHLVSSKDWDMCGQMSYLYTHCPMRALGASESVAAVSAANEEVSDGDYIAEAADGATTLEFLDDDEILALNEQDPDYEYRPVCVKGGGKCWATLPFAEMRSEAFYIDDLNEVDCATLAKIMRMIREEFDAVDDDLQIAVKMREQNDGDLHVVGYLYYYPENTQKMIRPSMLGEGAASFVRRPPGMLLFPQFLELLDFYSKKKVPILVGKPDTAPYDNAVAVHTHPEITRTLQDLTAPAITSEALRVKKICPYWIPEENQHFMRELSLPWSKTSSWKHDHPIHAAIRRMEVTEWIPKNIKSDCTVISMNNGNYRALEEAMESKPFNLKRFNPVVDIKDLGRYAHDGDVPTQVFSLPKIETPMALFHNSGQFMNEAALMQFFVDNPKVMYVYVSNVFPLASLVTEYSPQPSLYNYYRVGDSLVYIPEGHAGGKYEQPADPGILIARTITSADGRTTIQGGVVESCLNTHAMVWTRFALTPPTTIAMTLPGMMEIPRLLRGQEKSMCLIPTRIYTALVTYGKCLPNCKKEDIWGKLRQFEVNEQFNFPISHKSALVLAVLMVIKQDLTPDLQSKFYTDLMGEMKYKTIGHIIRWWDKKWAVRYGSRINGMVNEGTGDWLFPTVDVHLRQTDVPSVYGVSWKVPEGVRDNFMKRFDFWCRAKIRQIRGMKPKAKWAIDADGFMVHNFPHLNSRTISERKAELIEAGQIFHWLKTFEGHREQMINSTEVKQIFSYWDGTNFHLDSTPTLVDKFEPMKKADLEALRNNRPEDVRSITTVSSVTSNDLTQETVTKCQMCGLETPTPFCSEKCENYYNDPNRSTASLGGTYGSAFKKCKNCKNLHNAESAYCSKICEMSHKFPGEYPPKMGAEYHRPVIDSISITADDSDTTTSDSDDSTIASKMSAAARSLMQPETTGGSVYFSDAQSVEVRIRETLEKFKKNRPNHMELARGEVRWDEALKEKYKLDEAVEHAERVQAWQKMLRAKPSPRKPFSASGPALWDSLFPKRVGQRFRECPYDSLTRFANVAYPENDCLLDALHKVTNIPHEMLLFAACLAWPNQHPPRDEGLPDIICDPIGIYFGLHIKVVSKSPKGMQKGARMFGVKFSPDNVVVLNYWNGHFSPGEKPVKPLRLLKPIEEARDEESAVFKNFRNEVEAVDGITFVPWQPEVRRAEMYVRELWKGTTGTLGQTEVQKEQLKALESKLPMIAKMYPNRMLAYREGDPGCAKSYPIQRICAKQKYQTGNVFNVSLPVQTLETDWKDKLGVIRKHKATGKGTPSKFVTTFETTMVKQCWGEMMIRDEDKFPKGYAALVALMFPSAKYHLMLGDRYQSQWHEPNMQCALNDSSIAGEGNFYSQYSSAYTHGSYRFGPGIANFFCLPSFSKDRGGFQFSQSDILTVDQLRPFFPKKSELEVKEMFDRRITAFAAHASAAFGEQLLSTDTDTFSGTQGLSADLILVYVDIRVLRMTDPRLSYTVLTRAKNVIIILMSNPDGVFKQTAISNPVWGKLLEYFWRGARPGRPVEITQELCVNLKTTAILGELPVGTRHMLAGPPCHCTNRSFVEQHVPAAVWDDWLNPFNLPLIGGTRLDRESEVYKDQVFFKNHIIDWDAVRPPEPMISVPALALEPKVRTHVPIVSHPVLWERINHEVLNRERSELSWNGIWSEQKPDLPLWRADSNEIYSAGYQEARAMGKTVKESRAAGVMKQNAEGKFTPEALLWGARQLSSDAASFSAGLHQRIRRSTAEANRKEVIDEAPYGHAMWRAFKKYMQWGEAIPFDDTLWEESIIQFQERRADRSDQLKKMSLNRADPDYVSFLTAKTQWKLKSEHVEKAKPLQTILVMSDEYLFKFGPVGIYLLEQLLKYCPKYLYLHAKRTFEEMADWCSGFSEKEQYVMCDISGFDSTVRGGDVTLEKLFMQHFSIPQTTIDAYETDKMNFHTSTIFFGIMRFSGEIFTWLFNSVHTAARECLKYDLSPGVKMAVSGDDTLRQGSIVESSLWWNYSYYDTSVEKRFVSDRGEFCSYIVGKGVVAKNPRILWMRLQGQVERGKIDDVLLGYFEHFIVNYRLGDACYDLLTEDEMEYLAACNRFFFSDAKKLTKLHKKLDWSKVQIDSEDRVRGTGVGLIAALTALDMSEEPSPSTLEASSDLYGSSVSYANTLLSPLIEDEF